MMKRSMLLFSSLLTCVCNLNAQCKFDVNQVNPEHGQKEVLTKRLSIQSSVSQVVKFFLRAEGHVCFVGFDITLGDSWRVQRNEQVIFNFADGQVMELAVSDNCTPEYIEGEGVIASSFRGTVELTLSPVELEKLTQVAVKSVAINLNEDAKLFEIKQRKQEAIRALAQCMSF